MLFFILIVCGCLCGSCTWVYFFPNASDVHATCTVLGHLFLFFTSLAVLGNVIDTFMFPILYFVESTAIINGDLLFALSLTQIKHKNNLKNIWNMCRKEVRKFVDSTKYDIAEIREPNLRNNCLHRLKYTKWVYGVVALVQLHTVSVGFIEFVWSWALKNFVSQKTLYIVIYVVYVPKVELRTFLLGRMILENS